MGGPRAAAAIVAVLSLSVFAAVRASGSDARGEPLTSAVTPGEVKVPPPLPDPPPLPAARLRGLRFVEVAAASGLTGRQSDRPVGEQRGMTSGAAVADVEGDGDLDVYLTRIGKPNALFLNDGRGRFTEATAAAGVGGPSPTEGSSAAAFADIDGDGDLDLYVTGAEGGVDALYVNDGTGRFTDEAAARGVAQPAAGAGLGRQMHGATWSDFDHDGDMDLLTLQWDTNAYDPTQADPTAKDVCAATAGPRAGPPKRRDGTPPSRSRLFRNDGSGRFSDATAALGLPLDRIIAFTGQFADLTGDGWEDLVIAGDFCTSRVFRSEGGQRFTDITAGSGADTAENAMGSVIRDVDGDGILDWFVTSIAYPTEDGSCPLFGGVVGCTGNRLFLGRGDGTFTDATDRFGLRQGWWGWGAAIEDFDGDGTLEVVQTNGYDGPTGADPTGLDQSAFYDHFRRDPLRLFVRDGGTYRDAAATSGMADTGVGHALVPFDADGDGDLDVLVASSGEAPKLFRNDRPAGRAWLTVRAAEGALVTVVPGRGRPPMTGLITTSGSYESQKPAEFHVGLGDDGGPVERVEVRWPGDPSPRVLEQVAVNRVLTVRR